MRMSTSSDVALADTGETHMRLFFNLTMVTAASALAAPARPGAAIR